MTQLLSDGSTLLDEYEFDQVGFGSWFRHRLIETPNGFRIKGKPTFVTGPDDRSPTVMNYNPKGKATYHPRCGSCFLGQPHSMDYHRHELQRQGIDPDAPPQPDHWRGIVSAPLQPRPNDGNPKEDS